MFNTLVQQGIVLVIVTSCLPLAVCSMSSLLLSVLQTITSVQEQTLPYLVKITSVILVFYFCSGWFYREYINFFELSLSSVKILGGIR